MMILHPQVEYRTVRIDANTTAFEVILISDPDYHDHNVADAVDDVDGERGAVGGGTCDLIRRHQVVCGLLARLNVRQIDPNIFSLVLEANIGGKRWENM